MHSQEIFLTTSFLGYKFWLHNETSVISIISFYNLFHFFFNTTFLLDNDIEFSSSFHCFPYFYLIFDECKIFLKVTKALS